MGHSIAAGSDRAATDADGAHGTRGGDGAGKGKEFVASIGHDDGGNNESRATVGVGSESQSRQRDNITYLSAYLEPDVMVMVHGQSAAEIVRIVVQIEFARSSWRETVFKLNSPARLVVLAGNCSR